MPEARREIRRILVALDAVHDSRPALEAAAELAAELEAELTGLFIEDINLLNLARLPFAREFALGVPRQRTLNPETVERELRAVAQQARRTLEAMAQTRRLTWSFRVVRGVIAEEILSAAEESDLVTVGKSEWPHPRAGPLGQAARALASRGPGAVLLMMPGRAAGARRLVVTYDGSPCAERALDVGRRLARAREQSLEVALLADTPEEERRLGEAASERLQGTGVPAQFRALPPGEVEALKEVIGSDHDTLLILGSTCYPVPPEDLERLLAETGSPVLLIR